MAAEMDGLRREALSFGRTFLSLGNQKAHADSRAFAERPDDAYAANPSATDLTSRSANRSLALRVDADLD
jgi:hypothetical protein